MIDAEDFANYPGIKTLYEQCVRTNRFSHYGPEVYLQEVPRGVKIGRVMYAHEVGYTLVRATPGRGQVQPRGVWRFYFSVGQSHYFDFLAQLIRKKRIPENVLRLMDRAAAEFVANKRSGLTPAA